MKNTILLTLTQVYDFEMSTWTYTDDEGGVHELATVTGEAVDAAGQTWCVYTNCLPKSYDFRKGDLEKLIEREAYFLVDETGKTTKKGMPKLKLLGYPGGRGENSEGLVVVGEKTDQGAGAEQGEGPQQGETPAPESSERGAGNPRGEPVEQGARGGSTPPSSPGDISGTTCGGGVGPSVPDADTAPPSDAFDGKAEALAEAMRRLDCSKGMVVVELRKGTDHPIVWADVTEEDLWDLCASLEPVEGEQR